MFLSDFHTHSTFSSDGKNTMEEMAAAHYESGMNCICFTDHADDCMREADLSFTPDKYINKKGIYEEYLRVRDEFGDKLDIRFGIELSSPNQEPAIAEKLTSLHPYDFIIGSVHNCTGLNDYYFLNYTDEDECHRLIDSYLEEHLRMIETGGFDVVGHIGYLLKYMAKQGMFPDFTPHMDSVRSVLKLAIEKGIGIEINSSGLRANMANSIPTPPVIKLYRELGGEIITTGSDSHNTKDAGAGIAECNEIIKAAGFRYVTVFKDRRPEFIKI